MSLYEISHFAVLLCTFPNTNIYQISLKFVLKSIYNIIAMLSPELLQKFSENMAFQKVSSTQNQHGQLLDKNQYKDLMVSVFEYCESLQLSSETSYLAKIYLDIILNKSSFIDANQLSLISLCCIWMAIKFNESNQVSIYFNAQIICQHGGSTFSVDDLIAMEFHVLELLEYKLKYTTPYDYIQPFFQSFPWIKKSKPVLKSLIELSGAICELRNESAGDIFYGIFLGVLQLKNCILKPPQKYILCCLIKDQVKAQTISSLILQRYNEILSQFMQKAEDGSSTQQTQPQ